MDDVEHLGRLFEAERPRLSGVAFRMLGSTGEADDAVQEAWLRAGGADAGAVEDLRAWLTTIVARVCLTMLRARRLRREQPLEDVVPVREPRSGPEQEAVLADSVGLALLVVLDALSPAERLAFVLHDMFDLPFDEIAPLVDRSPPPPASSPAARDGGSAAPARRGGTGPASGAWSTPTSPRPATATSSG